MSCLGLGFGSGCSGGGSGCFLTRGPLDAGGFAAKFAQVVESRASHFAFADDFDGTDSWRVQRENTLDTDAETHAAHGECRPGSAALLGDHDPLKSLQAFLFLLTVAFLEADVNTDRIARPEFGEVFAQLRIV